MTSNIWLPEDLLAGIALYANQPGEERGSADRGQRFIFFTPLSIFLPPSIGFFMVRFGGHTYRLCHRPARTAGGESAIGCCLSWTCAITATIVCIFEHVQWRWVLNDRLARGQARTVPPASGAPRSGGSSGRGAPRPRSHCRCAPLLIHFIPDPLTYLVPLFLNGQCDRTPGAPGTVARSSGRTGRWGSVTLTLCSMYTVHPLHIRFTNICGAYYF
jgi:hypothetical protein